MLKIAECCCTTKELPHFPPVCGGGGGGGGAAGKRDSDPNQLDVSDGRVYIAVTSSLLCEGWFTEATGIKTAGKPVG